MTKPQRLLVSFTDQQRVELEAYRKAKGLRSLSEAVKQIVDQETHGMTLRLQRAGV